jgi:hypothetical protein
VAMLNPIHRLVLPLALATPALAQAKIPTVWVSPPASVSATIGTTNVVIDYHRPAVKGREIWGGLVPYSEVWRTGANDATTIRFDDPVKIDGKDVPAGTYGFFAIPTKGDWTLILNKTSKQWGAFDYDAKQDQLRWTVTPKAAPMQEWLTYTIDPLEADSATAHMHWEKLDVSFAIKVDVRAVMIAQIDRAIKDAKSDDWAVYSQAARYYYENDYKLDQALAWIDQSLKIQENYRPLEIKARILHKMRQDPKAMAALERAMEVAKDKKARQDYLDSLTKLMAEYKKS